MKKYIISYVVIFIIIAILIITKGIPMSISISKSGNSINNFYTTNSSSTGLLVWNLIILFCLLIYSLVITFKKNNTIKEKYIILFITLLSLCFIPLTIHTSTTWAAVQTEKTYYKALLWLYGFF